MKLFARTGIVACQIATVAACASTGSDDSASNMVEPPAQQSDAAGDEIERDAEVDTGLGQCSEDGWCTTLLPDVELTLTDIWPLEDRAFAIAEGALLGVKVLEWTAAEGVWRYIDDNSQNQEGRGGYAGTIWAPNADEVYFTAAPKHVYHGRRLDLPEMGWSWSRAPLDDESYGDDTGHLMPNHDHGNPWLNIVGFEAFDRSLGVWGTAPDDVYAWYSNTLYRRAPDGKWTVEYVVDDYDRAVGEHVYFVGAGGSGRDDVWFTGMRMQSLASYCALAVRKTPGGFTRVVDSDVSWTCEARSGVPISVRMRGWLGSVLPVTGGVMALHGTNQLVYISSGASGYTIDRFELPADGFDPLLAVAHTSVWGAPGASELWLSGFLDFTRAGVVRRVADPSDALTYELSSLAYNGAPVPMWVYQVRGTSNTNLWAIGKGHAFHKTTP